jgi:pyruvate-formate lyase
MNLDPAIFEDESSHHRLAGLMWTMVEQQVQQAAFNVVDSGTLRATPHDPKKYRSLVVRMAGISSFFVSLTKGLRDGLIARTQHGM